MLISRRKHIKSKLSVSPHSDRVHFKPRDFAALKSPAGHLLHPTFLTLALRLGSPATPKGLPRIPAPEPHSQQHQNYLGQIWELTAEQLFTVHLTRGLYSLVLGYRLIPRFAVANAQFWRLQYSNPILEAQCPLWKKRIYPYLYLAVKADHSKLACFLNELLTLEVLISQKLMMFENISIRLV